MVLAGGGFFGRNFANDQPMRKIISATFDALRSEKRRTQALHGESMYEAYIKAHNRPLGRRRPVVRRGMMCKQAIDLA